MCPIAAFLVLIGAARLSAQPPLNPPPPNLPVPTATVVAALVESLGDVDAEVRQNAAVSLANFGTDAVEPLTKTLRAANHDARAAAAYALSQIGGPAAPATAELVKVLRTKTKKFAGKRPEALGRIVAGVRPQLGDQRPLIPPVPVDAPPPAFPPGT